MDWEQFRVVFMRKRQIKKIVKNSFAICTSGI